MKKIIFLLNFFAATLSFAQYKIVVKSVDGNPIENATVSCSKKIIGKTNTAGELTFGGRCRRIEVRAKGFYDDEAVADRLTEVTLSTVDPKVKNIEAISLDDKSDPRALEILQNVTKNFDKNSPRALDSYSYKTYDKFSYDFDEDSIKAYNAALENRMDSLRLAESRTFLRNKKNDSLSHAAIMSVMRTSKLFLWERAREVFYSKQYGEKTKILDNRVSGMQDPVYEMLTLRTNRDRVPREIREENRNLYRYFLTDTVDIEGRKNYVIRFRQVDYKQPVQRRKYNGYIYVDTDSYALKKIESNSKIKSEGSITSIWKPIDGKWFLSKETVKMHAGTTYLDPKYKKKDQSNAGRKKFGNYVYLLSDYFDFQVPSTATAKDFRGYTAEVENTGGGQMAKYRTDSLSAREKNTYVKIDSLGRKFNVDAKAGFVSNLLKGNIRSGIFDFPISKIFDYNVYEHLRLGAGVKLNERFNKYISPDAYLAYGFRDHNWKYGAGVDFKTSLKRTSIIRAEYYNDVDPSGKFSENQWNFRMNVMNAGVDVNNDKFYKYHGAKLSYTADIDNALSLIVAAKRDREEAGFSYDFMNLGNRFDNFSTLVSLKYAPNSKNIMTPSGKQTYEQNFPEVYLNYEQGLKALGGDLSYSRVDALLLHSFKTRAGTTGVRLFGGLFSGDAPIWHNFTGTGLASGNTDGINFTLSSYLGFATMPSGKYFNDKFVGYYLTHRIPWYFKSFGKNTSSFDVVWRGEIGNMAHPENHHFQFEKLNHLYQEVGLEWNNFLSSQFNLGAFYRVGYYATPGFKQNFAIQLKLKALGF